MIELTTNHTGKMEGINSISTSVLLNPRCWTRQSIPGSICQYCFAKTMLHMYSALEAKLARNTEILTSRILDDDELPDTSGMKIFRFESFGDLNNVTQLENYLNIVKKNQHTRFTLWTKQYGLVYSYFISHEVPPNFTLILSSLIINRRIKETWLQDFQTKCSFAKGQIKDFTVYNFDYIKEHWSEMDLNCGSKYCLGCRLCYDLNDVEHISEILKADQDKVDAFLKCNDPDKIQRQLKLLDDLIEL